MSSLSNSSSNDPLNWPFIVSKHFSNLVLINQTFLHQMPGARPRVEHRVDVSVVLLAAGPVVVVVITGIEQSIRHAESINAPRLMDETSKPLNFE